MSRSRLATSISEHALTWLDVFTATPLTGNQLAVVHDADAVDDETMLAFARETKLSETTFVQTASAAGADYRNRIWMPLGEMPFAGHPSLGTAVAVALARGVDAATFVQQTQAGSQPVEVLREDRVWRTSMLQEPATFGELLDPAPILAALNLPVGAAHPELPFQYVSTGTPHVMAALADPAALQDARPDLDAFRATMGPSGRGVIYLFALREDGDVSARSFFLDIGFVGEDPATGSAAGPLIAYLDARRVMSKATIHQGVAMGRASVLRVALVDGRPQVGGDCVVVATGRVTL